MERRGETPVDVSGAPMASADAPPAAIEEARDEDDDDGWGGLFEDLPEAEGVGTGLGPSPEESKLQFGSGPGDGGPHRIGRENLLH